jgi:phosphoglycolate phosphatase/putative hydrolase of the HAD superfamily
VQHLTTAPDILSEISKYRLFIFDLDGTLYDQKKLRARIASGLISNFLKRRISFAELKIIRSFRRQRENHKSYTSETIHDDQYQWVRNDIDLPLDQIKYTIDKWMFWYPIQFIFAYRFPGLDIFFDTLRQNGKIIAILSDYPIGEKLQALNLAADAFLCSTDRQLNTLKPSAKGIAILCEQFNIPKEKTIFIGDREDTDGKSAEMAKIDFLKVKINRARRGLFYPGLAKMIQNSYD